MIASPWALSQQNTVVFDGTQVIDVVIGIVLVVPAGGVLAAARTLGTTQRSAG
ncbi:hypothetical protein ACFU6M_32425 [Streptomyces bottropensis]